VPSVAITLPPSAFGATAGVVPTAAIPYKEKVEPDTRVPPLPEERLIELIAEVVWKIPAINCAAAAVALFSETLSLLKDL
jgi:hypothetical protein